MRLEWGLKINQAGERRWSKRIEEKEASLHSHPAKGPRLARGGPRAGWSADIWSMLHTGTAIQIVKVPGGAAHRPKESPKKGYRHILWTT